MINSSLSVNGRIRSITIEKECESHPSMQIEMIPDKMNDVSELENIARIGSSVEADIDGILVMCGKISQVSGKVSYKGAAVSVLVVSDSVESDTNRVSRVFQSPEKTWKDITDKISGKVAFTINRSDLSSEKAENIVIQYNESDFEFVCRLAQEHNARVFVNANEHSNSSAIIGDDIKKSISLENNDIISAERSFTEFSERLDIQCSKYVELGTKVSCLQNDYVVTALRTEQLYDDCKFFLRLERIIKPRKSDRQPLSVLSLGTATITDNKDPDSLGRIQVAFNETEDSISDKKIWIQYINTLTAGEGGVFFIPDKDEQVQVICQNGQCFAYGCVRSKAASDKISDTDKKSIMLYDQTLVTEKEKTTFTSGDYTISVDKDSARINNKDFDLTMNNDSIAAGNNSSRITVDKKAVTIDVNNKGTITVRDSSVTADAAGKSRTQLSGSEAVMTSGNTKISLRSGKMTADASAGVVMNTSKLDVK